MKADKYLNLVEILKEKISIDNSNGTNIIIKEIPDLDEYGVLDPRVVDIINNSKVCKKKKQSEPFIFKNIRIDELRSGMGFENKDITHREITIEYKNIESENGPINIRIYRPKNHFEKLSCMIFFHGGGFVGGTLDVVENPCKAISDKANIVVISVDYRLAPENPYPKGLTDCFNIVKWAYNNSKTLNINKDKLCVGGDSSGGNLAAVCSIKDRDLGSNIIKYQALIYPMLTFKDDYNWNISKYNIRSNTDLIHSNINEMKDFIDKMNTLYLQNNENPDDKYISPLSEINLKNLPKTLIVTAEYDFLRIQGEEYGKRLINANVNTRIVRYNGMDHAFIDKCGIYPQAEDCFDEIASDLIII